MVLVYKTDISFRIHDQSQNAMYSIGRWRPQPCLPETEHVCFSFLRTTVETVIVKARKKTGPFLTLPVADDETRPTS
jgi:hypothetical protein